MSSRPLRWTLFVLGLAAAHFLLTAALLVVHAHRRYPPWLEAFSTTSVYVLGAPAALWERAWLGLAHRRPPAFAADPLLDMGLNFAFSSVGWALTLALLWWVAQQRPSTTHPDPRPPKAG